MPPLDKITDPWLMDASRRTLHRLRPDVKGAIKTRCGAPIRFALYLEDNPHMPWRLRCMRCLLAPQPPKVAVPR